MTAIIASQLDRCPEISTPAVRVRASSCSRSRPTTSMRPVAGVIRSISGNSAKVRPTLPQNSLAIAVRSAGVFSGKASSRPLSTIRCLPVSGPSTPTMASPMAEAASTGRVRTSAEATS